MNGLERPVVNGVLLRCMIVNIYICLPSVAVHCCMIKQEDLPSSQWDDVRVVQNSTGDYILVFIYETQRQCDEFMKLLRENKFYLSVSEDPKTGFIVVSVRFTDANLHITEDTGLSTDTYPPFVLLKDGSVRFLSAGVRTAPGDFQYAKPPLVATWVPGPGLK